jgi:hypothetical protein
MKMPISWDVTPCSLLEVLTATHHPDDEAVSTSETSVPSAVLFLYVLYTSREMQIVGKPQTKDRGEERPRRQGSH